MTQATTMVAKNEMQKAGTRASCRFCGCELEHIFVDLGTSPLVQSFLSAEQLSQMEPFYPLQVYVCGKCFLVQLQEFVAPENIFSDYLYFASYSASSLPHATPHTNTTVHPLPITQHSLLV